MDKHSLQCISEQLSESCTSQEVWLILGACPSRHGLSSACWGVGTGRHMQWYMHCIANGCGCTSELLPACLGSASEARVASGKTNELEGREFHGQGLPGSVARAEVGGGHGVPLSTSGTSSKRRQEVYSGARAQRVSAW